jgi:predicted phosphohydrolase
MKVFAIGDLHLSGAVDKPMDVFGVAWDKHFLRIQTYWRERVATEDVVLIPGDISWAMHLDEAKPDLEFIANLPGEKILVRGNHDYWWNSLSKVRAALPPTIRALQNDSIRFDGVSIAGSRGWSCPGTSGFTASDEKIYERELIRLELSLKSLPQSGLRIAMLHYPPFDERQRDSGFTALLEKYGVQIVVYGHLHGKSGRDAFCGMRNGVRYELVACDYLDFAPKLIAEIS